MEVSPVGVSLLAASPTGVSHIGVSPIAASPMGAPHMGAPPMGGQPQEPRTIYPGLEDFLPGCDGFLLVSEEVLNMDSQDLEQVTINPSQESSLQYN